MPAGTLISVDEYLNTSYSPDREYVDGQVVERNSGEKTHSRIQRKLITFIDRRAKDLGIEVFPEQRVHERRRAAEKLGLRNIGQANDAHGSPPTPCARRAPAPLPAGRDARRR